MASTLVMGLQLALAGSALAGPSPTTIFVQNAVPNIDAARSCRAEAATGLGLYQQDYQTCVKSEQAVREQLNKDWSSFSTSDRNTCRDMTVMGGQATYTELLTCLEMMRDARRLSRENNTEGVGNGATIGSGSGRRR